MNFEIYDNEVFKALFLYIGHNVATNKRVSFQISKYRDDTYAFVKHLEESGIDWQVSFNGINYDAQIQQYILDNYERWVNLTALEKCGKIRAFSDDIIERIKYEQRLPYYSFSLKQCDLFRIHHFDNEARRTSLKWIQFAIDYENVEVTPIPFDKEDLTQDDILEITKYCHNDVSSTLSLYELTRGLTDNELYKGRDKIQDRLDIIEEMRFGDVAMNWSDVKIGDMINLKIYRELTRRTDNEIYNLKLNRKTKTGFTFASCIPSYVEFKTPEFRAFFDTVSKERVRLGNDEVSKKKKKKGFPFTYKGTTYVVAQGGIHSKEGCRVIIPKDNEILMDADVGSQYPNAIIKRMLFPAHLGQLWLKGYMKVRDNRMYHKNLSKDKTVSDEIIRKHNGISEMLKLSLNGGGFGKLNEGTNWQYDPFCAFSCTIGNQFEILMLCETMELNGIHVVSANTDGIVCLFDRLLLPTYYRLCSEWEIKVGNNQMGKLEYTPYAKMYQSSVNDYLAIKIDPKEKDFKKLVKKKGDFMTDYEINKNKSRRIIPLAIENYFLKGIPVEKTIMTNRNIFNFCIGVKASKDFHYEAIQRDGTKDIYHRLVRYYISKNGKRLKKVKNPDSESPGNDVMDCEAGGWLCTVANLIDVGDDIRSYNIHYRYYIERAEKKIKLIMGGNKKDPLPNKQQLQMF
jgi:hypothetical protein